MSFLFHVPSITVVFWKRASLLQFVKICFIPEFFKLTGNVSFATLAHVTFQQGQETLKEEKHGIDPVATMPNHTQVSQCSCENLRYIRKEVISFLTCQQERTPMMSSLSDMEDCV